MADDERRGISRKIYENSPIGKGLRAKLEASVPYEAAAEDLLRTASPQDLAEYAVHCTEVASGLETRLNKAELEKRIDPLTNILNRRGLDEELEHALKLVRAKGKGNEGHIGKFSYLAIDIDHFSEVNNNYGHPTGDYVLEAICNIFSSIKDATSARKGGEEFVIFTHRFPEVSASSAAKHYGNQETGLNVAENLRKTVENTKFEYKGKIIPVTISIGVSGYDFGGYTYSPEIGGKSELKQPDDARDMDRRADLALYYAKRHGRNQVKLYADERSIMIADEVPLSAWERLKLGWDVARGKRRVR